jgi:predicted metalloenzyme YecM
MDKNSQEILLNPKLMKFKAKKSELNKAPRLDKRQEHADYLRFRYNKRSSKYYWKNKMDII